MTTNTTTLVQQLRAALCTAHALLFGSRPHGQADIDMLRAASRQGITAADQWLAEQPPQAVAQPVGIMSRATYSTSSGAGYKQISFRFDDLHDAEQVRLWAVSCGANREADPTVQPVAQPLKGEQILASFREAVRGDTLRLTRDVGPYEVTEPTYDAIKLVRAIERACASAWGVTLADSTGQPAGDAAKPGAAK